MKIYGYKNGFASYYTIEEKREVVISFRDNRLHLDSFCDLKDLLSDLNEQYPKYKYTLDFWNIDGIGSTALGVFIKFCIDKDTKMYIIRCKPLVKKIVDILELDELFVIES
jgi:anti-anti-sigma regulatory factor